MSRTDYVAEFTLLESFLFQILKDVAFRSLKGELNVMFDCTILEIFVKH